MQNVDEKKFSPAAASLCRRSFCREKYLRKAFWITWIFNIWSHANQNPGGCSALKEGTRNKKFCLFVNKDVGMIVGRIFLPWHGGRTSSPAPPPTGTAEDRESWFYFFNFWSGLMCKAKGLGCWSNLLDRANLDKVFLDDAGNFHFLKFWHIRSHN